MQRSFGVFCSAVLGMVLIVGGILGCRKEAEEPLKPSRLSDLAKPAVVMMKVNFKAQVSVPDLTITESQLNSLRDKIVAMVRQGEVGSSEEAIKVAAIKEFLAHPMNYIAPTGARRTVEAGFTSQGSGFIVTPDGYVVTNAHVAAPNNDSVKKALAELGLNELVMEDVRDLQKELGGAATPEMSERLKQIAQGFYEQYMQVGKVERTAFTLMGADMPGLAVVSKGYPSEVSMVVGEPIPGKDVAILKMEGGSNFPTLPLGDDKALQNGDKLYVMGYPAAATFHPLLSQESQSEPTFTSGVVSARKSMTGGWEVIQMDAAITHGNSGGPVLDSTGKIIGIATFGSIGDTGQEIAGMNFVIPTTIVNQFLERNNVKPGTSIVSVKYAQALEQNDQQHYKHALALFQEVNALSPGHPYVQKYITQTQLAITQGKDRSWEESLWIYITAAIGALLVVAAMVLFRHRGTPRPLPITPTRA